MEPGEDRAPNEAASGPNYQNELEPGNEPASGPFIKVNSGGFQFSAAVETTRLGSVEEYSRREKERTSALCDDKDMARHTDVHRDDVLDDNVSGTDRHRDDDSEVVVSETFDDRKRPPEGQFASSTTDHVVPSFMPSLPPFQDSLKGIWICHNCNAHCPAKNKR